MVRTYGGNNGSSIGSVFTHHQSFKLSEKPQKITQRVPEIRDGFTDATPSPDFIAPSPVAGTGTGNRPVTRALQVPCCNEVCHQQHQPHPNTHPQSHQHLQHQHQGQRQRQLLTPVPHTQPASPQVPYSPLPKNHGPTWAGRDAMGNIFILPRQFEVGLCQNCRRLFGAASTTSSLSSQPQQLTSQISKPVDYDALLNQKRNEESVYRNSADPFVLASSGQRGPPHEMFMTRINDAPPPHSYDEFGLGNELRDLGGVLSRIQQNMMVDSDDSSVGSYGQPNMQSGSQTRKSWSAPVVESGVGQQDWLQGLVSSSSGGHLSDPLQHLHQKGDHSFSTPQSGYNPSVNEKSGRRGVSDRDSYLRDLELQIAEQRGRKEQEKQGKMDWWEKSKEPPFQVNPPQRPHPSQTADQLPDPKESRKKYENDLRLQMEYKKQREAEEREKIIAEEKKLEKRIQEQQDRMRREFEEEQAKKKAKEEAKNKRQEQLARRQIEMQTEAANHKKMEAERRRQERRAAMEPDQSPKTLGSSDISRSSSPTFTRRSNSPPVPTMRNHMGSSIDGSSRSVSSASGAGLSSGTEDEQQAEVLNQLTTMKTQLDKLEKSNDNSKQRRKSQVWGDIAEI